MSDENEVRQILVLRKKRTTADEWDGRRWLRSWKNMGTRMDGILKVAVASCRKVGLEVPFTSTFDVRCSMFLSEQAQRNGMNADEADPGKTLGPGTRMDGMKKGWRTAAGCHSHFQKIPSIPFIFDWNPSISLTERRK